MYSKVLLVFVGGGIGTVLRFLLNTLINNMHAEAFEIIDCLKCANCCSSISPVVTDNDISKISKHLRKKPNKVVQEYMLLDNDKDYVMNRTPCPFLMPDNCCNIYDSRNSN